MKKILLARGSGICTSTAARKKVEEMLDANGYAGQYEITQCTVAEATPKSVNFDMLIATTMAPKGLQCPYVNGICYLTGVGMDAANKQILELMEQ